MVILPRLHRGRSRREIPDASHLAIVAPRLRRGNRVHLQPDALCLRRRKQSTLIPAKRLHARPSANDAGYFEVEAPLAAALIPERGADKSDLANRSRATLTVTKPNTNY